MLKHKDKLRKNAAVKFAFVIIKTSSFLTAVYANIYDGIPKA